MQRNEVDLKQEKKTRIEEQSSSTTRIGTLERITGYSPRPEELSKSSNLINTDTASHLKENE